MIRTAAQVIRVGQVSCRFHREVFTYEGREFRFLAMAPLPETRRGQERQAQIETTRWLTDGRTFLLVRGVGMAREVLPREGLPTRAADGYPLNCDTALKPTDWTMGKDDPDPRTGERAYYGEALEVNGEWWRFWALAPSHRGKSARWFTNGRQFGLVTGPVGKGTLRHTLRHIT